MKKNGYTTKELLTVIVILGIFTITILASTSYAYKDTSRDYYNQTINIIEKQAELYGSTISTLKDEKTLVITVEDLVNKGYYIGDDEDGNVTDPRNSKATLNGMKIKLTYNENGSIKAKVIEEE